MQRVKYSIIIHGPTDDVMEPGFEQIHCSFALIDLTSLFAIHLPIIKSISAPSHLKESIDSFPFPYHIIEYFRKCEEAGHYRAELLEGAMKYCMYIQPEQNV